MNLTTKIIIKHRRSVIVVFVIIALVCIFLQAMVPINYDMADYLPPDAQSTKALAIIESEFGQAIPNASVMVKDVSIAEAMAYKQALAAIEGVSDVAWLDDAADIKKPLDLQDQAVVEQFYKEGAALYAVTIDAGAEDSACEAILALIGEDNALAGDVPSLNTLQGTTSSEALKAILILVPVMILILILSTSSIMEPLFYLAAIGISIVINMGTNVLFGEISFMTHSVSPILQMACSLDYAIFLLHSFSDNRKKYDRVDDAMRQAIRESLPSVAASAVTTMFGFMALMFMNFQIGADLGLNLVKGIILSFISVMVFLPALTLVLYKLIDKTRHRNLTPDFSNIGKGIARIGIPVMIVVALLVVPGYLGQRRTEFTYGTKSAEVGTRSGRDAAAIDAVFGQSTLVALLVPRGDVAKEEALSQDLKDIRHVTGVVSYTSAVDAAIPADFLSDRMTDQFYSENFARIVIYTDTLDEGETAFRTVEQIQAAARSYYGSEVYSIGTSTSLLDMKNLVQKDNTLVNLIAVLSIFLVLMITFRSATLPLILLLTIETGIWINLSIPYFTGVPINFTGYLIVSTVQLGSTVDYAILLTNRYLVHRRRMPAADAIRTALGENFKSILVSASALATAGFILFATSSNDVISGLGLLLGRGTLISVIMVSCFLPPMLKTFDGLIRRTTIRPRFYMKTVNLAAYQPQGEDPDEK